MQRPSQPTPHKKKTPIARKGTVSGAELLNTEFETFTLPNELGRFLGNLERYMLAISLTGDKGAGKTHFSFELAGLFLKAGYSVKYFSLELGIMWFGQKHD